MHFSLHWTTEEIKHEANSFELPVCLCCSYFDKYSPELFFVLLLSIFLNKVYSSKFGELLSWIVSSTVKLKQNICNWCELKYVRSGSIFNILLYLSVRESSLF